MGLYAETEILCDAEKNKTYPIRWRPSKSRTIIYGAHAVATSSKLWDSMVDQAELCHLIPPLSAHFHFRHLSGACIFFRQSDSRFINAFVSIKKAILSTNSMRKKNYCFEMIWTGSGSQIGLRSWLTDWKKSRSPLSSVHSRSVRPVKRSYELYTYLGIPLYIIVAAGRLIRLIYYIEGAALLPTLGCEVSQLQFKSASSSLLIVHPASLFYNWELHNYDMNEEKTHRVIQKLSYTKSLFAYLFT